jgi:RNA polymerase sigma factor (sigma-70 family)
MTQLLRRPNSDAAFERLYKRHVKDVYRYSLAVLGERSDAEDVTQTTFLNAYRAFQRGERPEKPENWLITIAHNVCRQRFRQARHRPNEVEFDEAAGAATDEQPGPSAEDLRRAFSQLPATQREALVMRELEGRPYAEIAGILGISVSALETLIFRARRNLREQLDERLTCSEAAFAISKEADGRLAPDEQRALRAHIRACPDCATTAQRQRALRGALKSMLAVPLPPSLSSFFGGGAGAAASAAGATGIVVKAASVLTAGALIGGGSYVGVAEVHAHRTRPHMPEVSAAMHPQSRPQVIAGSAERLFRLRGHNAENRGRALARGVHRGRKQSPPGQRKLGALPVRGHRSTWRPKRAHTPSAARATRQQPYLPRGRKRGSPALSATAKHAALDGRHAISAGRAETTPPTGTRRARGRSRPSPPPS